MVIGLGGDFDDAGPQFADDRDVCDVRSGSIASLYVRREHVRSPPMAGPPQRKSALPSRAIAGRGEPYSITSSAAARSVGGIVRPRAFAVFRLMWRENRVGSSTGS